MARRFEAIQMRPSNRKKGHTCKFSWWSSIGDHHSTQGRKLSEKMQPKQLYFRLLHLLQLLSSSPKAQSRSPSHRHSCGMHLLVRTHRVSLAGHERVDCWAGAHKAQWEYCIVMRNKEMFTNFLCNAHHSVQQHFSLQSRGAWQNKAFAMQSPVLHKKFPHPRC